MRSNMSTIERGGLPFQEVSRRGRREFLKGVVAGAAVVAFSNDFINHTDPKLAEVEAEVREELKQQGVLPPTDQHKQLALHNEDSSLGLYTNTGLPAEERERLRNEGKAASDYLRDYNIQLSKLMWKKAPLLQIRAYVDFAGVIGGGAMILKKLFGKAGNR